MVKCRVHSGTSCRLEVYGPFIRPCFEIQNAARVHPPEQLTHIAGIALFGELVPGLQMLDDRLPVIRHPPEVYLVDERDKFPRIPLRYGPSAPPLKNID